MGAIIMDKAVVGDECVIAAGAVITEHKVIPPRSLVVGMPGKVHRQLTEEEVSYLRKSADNYVNDAKEYQFNLKGVL
jgi:carbonic anhydrase/acetyltransferase-like protein (isoleucine patch superfamily)